MIFVSVEDIPGAGVDMCIRSRNREIVEIVEQLFDFAKKICAV